MAQDLVFGMLAHTLRSILRNMQDVQNLYVTIFVFLPTVLLHPEGLSALKCALPVNTSIEYSWSRYLLSKCDY
jgi:hypothetical protein